MRGETRAWQFFFKFVLGSGSMPTCCTYASGTRLLSTLCTYSEPCTGSTDQKCICFLDFWAVLQET
jgi:hypothetical protein